MSLYLLCALPLLAFVVLPVRWRRHELDEYGERKDIDDGFHAEGAVEAIREWTTDG